MEELAEIYEVCHVVRAPPCLANVHMLSVKVTRNVNLANRDYKELSLHVTLYSKWLSGFKAKNIYPSNKL